MRQAIIFVFLTLAAIVNGQQAIENIQFEMVDATSNTGLKAWKSNDMYDISADHQVVHSGAQSIKIQSKPGKQFGAFMQSIPITSTGSAQKITVSAWVKRQEIEQYTGCWIQVMAGENSLAFDNMYKQQLKGTADWELITTSVIADETADNMTIGGLMVGSGTVWFDDISVTFTKFEPRPLPDSLQTYLEEALSIMEKHALYRDSVDWAAVRKSTFLLASEADSYEACYPAIRTALGHLGDHHSFLMAASDSKSWEKASEKQEDLPKCAGKMLENGIAYVSMPAFSSGDEKANTRFADQTHDLLRSLDSQSPKAWVFDLRENQGGNCWPMLAAIGPLLGEGICGYFVAPGQKPSPWSYKKGASFESKRKVTKTTKPYKLKQKMPKLAVLTGPMTGSSGEVVTIAFRGRPNCKSFGQPTYGVSTGNENFQLRDGAQIFLTGSVYADRNMNLFGKKVVPDQETSLDQALEAAVKWLME